MSLHAGIPGLGWSRKEKSFNSWRESVLQHSKHKDENKTLHNPIANQQTETRKASKERDDAQAEKDDALRSEHKQSEYMEENEIIDNRIENLQTEIRKVRQERDYVQAERDEALRRLSELVSVQLRDNNPNIVDLSDVYRPTKLAEMFSELYDNEWTAAYTVMEETGFTERQIIDFLLDVIMEAYTFCKEELDKCWRVVLKWFLDDRSPSAQQTRKALKDGRKVLVVKHVPEIQQEFTTYLSLMCHNEVLKTLLMKKEVQDYFHVCIKISLLMNANDPPPFLECCGWKPFKERDGVNEAVGSEYSRSPVQQSELTEWDKQPFGPDKEKATNNTLENNDLLQASQTSYPFDIAEANIEKRETFEKNVYKEYTNRGQYVEFSVWPAMYLQKGEILSKGIAQGSNSNMFESSDKSWVWWKSFKRDDPLKAMATTAKNLVVFVVKKVGVCREINNRHIFNYFRRGTKLSSCNLLPLSIYSMGTAGHKYQRVPLSETGSTGDMRIRRYVCKCYQGVLFVYESAKKTWDRGLPLIDCLEGFAFIFCCGCLTKLWKYLSRRYAKSDKPSYKWENTELHSIKSERGLTSFEILSMQLQLDQKDNEIHDLKENVRKLAQDKRQAEMEKQDALTRLSEVISVKLRDNNPNIADLNDPFRPTKLAEMFSELYDNEWTALYTVLEEYEVKNKHTINFLLDVFMESFAFCNAELETNWQLVAAWYLDENLPNSQSLKKALKDGRKSMVPRLLTEMEKKFDTYLCGFCKNASLRPVLTSGKMKEYVSSCVKLSLLMSASDPPVVVDCPGWVPCTPDYQSEQDEHSGVFGQTNVNAEGDERNKNSTSDLKERRNFNKELFKEYTVRGNYVEFFVWPVMFLHENGPVLTKGIAQGAEDKIISDDDHRWEWWKTTNNLINND
ncbi:uncharacterized protein LOC128225670 [Mya arenaria]|uniref:uncharacterized protein LOC128225670 n=1 Tax=Mya arenaria TaxID=6604 RepID=UPI0022E1E47E|nr:uncharacterized protein LOC128225670 [Mya arenaria]